MSYQGFSFAFQPYMDVGLLDLLDEPLVSAGLKAWDPLSFREQISKVAKLAIVSSDDEFMQMDWTNVWSDDLNMLESYGEQHLMIAPNADHVLLTNLRGVFSSLVTFARSIARG